MVSTFEIFRLAKLISDNIVFFMPRNADMNQVCMFMLCCCTEFKGWISSSAI